MPASALPILLRSFVHPCSSAGVVLNRVRKNSSSGDARSFRKRSSAARAASN